MHHFLITPLSHNTPMIEDNGGNLPKKRHTPPGSLYEGKNQKMVQENSLTDNANDTKLADFPQAT